MSRSLWVKFGYGLLLLAGIIAMYQILAARTGRLPVYMSLPAVTLINQDQQTFDLEGTRGMVVVLSPIYTHCPDICPVTTAKMKQIQDRIQTEGLSAQVQLVTFTVDPERDGPEVLKRFSGNFHIAQGNWVFLTGTSDQIEILIKRLGLYVERVYYLDGTAVPQALLPNPEPNTPYLVNHTDRLFLVDRQGKVRALPPGSRSDVNSVMQLIEQLVNEQESRVNNAF